MILIAQPSAKLQASITPEDVQHIVMTHLDFDPADGLPDFSHAQVHVHQKEVVAIRNDWRR
jgi:glyoxylase-like metal-dependent hydrolase (beta-lactamase superfamily II)